MKHITVYNNYYKDEVMSMYELNTIQTKDFIESLLSNTSYDILITNKENKINDIRKR